MTKERILGQREIEINDIKTPQMLGAVILTPAQGQTIDTELLLLESMENSQERNSPLTEENIKDLIARELPSAQSSLDIYLQQIRQYPPLNLKQEQILFAYLKQGVPLADVRKDEQFLATISPEEKDKFKAVLDDSQDIKQMVVNCNLPLVIWKAKQYQRKGLPLLDLIQEGNAGLIRSVETYDPNKAKFSTYAVLWIRQSITRALADKTHLARLPVYMYERVRRARRLINEYLVLNGSSIEPEELKRLLITSENFSEAEAKSVMVVMQSGITSITSLDKSISHDTKTTLEHFVEDKGRGGTEEEAIKRVEGDYQDDLIKEVKAAIKRAELSETEEQVVSLLFGLSGLELSLEEVAEKLNLQDKWEVLKIRESSLYKLRQDEELLKKWWEIDPPSFLYGSMSAEKAAFALGLFDEGPGFVVREITNLPFHLKVFFDAKVASNRAKIESRGKIIYIGDEDGYYFNLARIKIWENMANVFNKEDLSDPELRKDIYGGDKWRIYFDPNFISKLFRERRRNIDNPTTRRILSYFLGFEDEQAEVLSVNKVASQFELSPDIIVKHLHEGLRAIEREPTQVQLRRFDEEVRELRLKGLNSSEIAKKFEATHSQVDSAIERLMRNKEITRKIPSVAKVEKETKQVSKSKKAESTTMPKRVKTVKLSKEELLRFKLIDLEEIAIDIIELIKIDNFTFRQSDNHDGDQTSVNMLKDLQNRIAQLRKFKPFDIETILSRVIERGLSIEGLKMTINLSDYSTLLGVKVSSVRKAYNKLAQEQPMPPLWQRNEEIEKLRNLGLSRSKIAKRVGKSEHAVATIIGNLIKSGKATNRVDSRIQEAHAFDLKVEKLKDKGLRGPDIAQVLKVPYQKVSSSLYRLNKHRQTEIHIKGLSVQDIIGLQAKINNSREQGATTGNIFKSILQEYPLLREKDKVINLSDFGRLLGVSRERMRQLYNKINEEQSSLSLSQDGHAEVRNTADKNFRLTDSELYYLAKSLQNMNGNNIHPDDQKELNAIIASLKIYSQSESEADSKKILQETLVTYRTNRQKVAEANIDNDNALFILGILSQMASGE